MARTRPVILAAAALVYTGGCCFFCERGVPFVICPAESAVVGEAIEVTVTGNLGGELTIEWSLDGEAELSDETSESAVITPTSPGVIIVTVTATDERIDGSATGSCSFNAIEGSDPGSRGL